MAIHECDWIVLKIDTKKKKHLEMQDEKRNRTVIWDDILTPFFSCLCFLFSFDLWTCSTSLFSYKHRPKCSWTLHQCVSTVPWFQRVRVCLFACQSLGSPGSFGWGRLQPLGSAPGRTAESAYRSAQLGMTSPFVTKCHDSKQKPTVYCWGCCISIIIKPVNFQEHRNTWAPSKGKR